MKHTFISIIVLVVLLAGYITYEVSTTEKALSPSVPQTPSVANTEQNKNTAESESRGNSSTQTSAPQTDSQAKTFTMSEVAKHNSSASCYTVVRGTVYNLTSFINEHPGGAQNILRLCGIDGTSAFENKHGGRPGPEQELKGHEIGTLAR